jgi:DNA-binding transcriptional LysR family regulator
MRERGSGSRRIIELALERHGAKVRSLNIAMELDSTEAIKSAVEAGLGVGFVSRWAIAKDLRLGKSFKIVEIRGLRIPRDFLIASAKGPELQGLAKEFRRFLFARAEAPQSVRKWIKSNRRP